MVCGIGVHGEKRCPEPRNAFDASGNGVADIVQLEVEEDALAGAGQHAREVDAARKGELITDLVERDGFAEPCDQRLRLADRRHVERDDQSLARIKLHGRSPPSLSQTACSVATPSCQELGGIDELAHDELELTGRARVLELVHLVECLLGIGHRHLLRDAPARGSRPPALGAAPATNASRRNARARRRPGRRRGSGRRRAAARRARAPPRSSRSCS